MTLMQDVERARALALAELRTDRPEYSMAAEGCLGYRKGDEIQVCAMGRCYLALDLVEWSKEGKDGQQWLVFKDIPYSTVNERTRFYRLLDRIFPTDLRQCVYDWNDEHHLDPKVIATKMEEYFQEVGPEL